MAKEAREMVAREMVAEEARETVAKEAKETVSEEARNIVAKEARDMVAKETMLVLVTGSALAVKLTASLPGPHALNAEEQNPVPAMVAFTIVEREEKEANVVP